MGEKSIGRIARTTAKNSTHGSQTVYKFDARSSWSELEARIKRLESAIARLEREDTEWDQPDSKAVKRKLLKKRGPKTIPDYVLANRRDELIGFFESNWPELEPLCTPYPDFRALSQAFNAFASPGVLKTPWGIYVTELEPGIMGNHTDAAKRLAIPKTSAQLQIFLRTQQKRFAANPRQLANAMAGCPELSFWTSLKRCQKIPYRFGTDNRAMRSYIRRNHPRLHAKLAERSGLTALAAFCSEYRTDDTCVARLTAEMLTKFWNAGNRIVSSEISVYKID